MYNLFDDIRGKCDCLHFPAHLNVYF